MFLRITIEAFAAETTTRATLEQAATDSRLSRSRMTVRDGGLAGAIAYFRENPTPQVLIVEETGDDRALIAALGQLAEVVEPGVKVIVIGTLNDVGLYRTLVGQGVSDYLLAPPEAGTVVDSILGLFSDPASIPRGRAIAFFGAGGGVGTSAVAHNVAWLLARTYKEPTILADLDFSFGCADLAFNLESKQSAADVLAQSDRMDDVLFDKCLIPHGDNLKVLASSGTLHAASALPSEAVEKFLDLSKGAAGFTVLDLPHIWTDWTLAALEIADEAVIVSRPDLTGLRESKNIFAALASRRGAKPTRLALNKIGESKKTELSAKDFMEATSTHSVLSIPYAVDVFQSAMNNGQMIGEAAKSHAAVDGLRKVMAAVSGRENKLEKSDRAGGILGWLRSGGAKKDKDGTKAGKGKAAE
ncbi:MAG: pilus assembly protein CpaF [Alphaproteobacteria bacterium]|nr:pilus assembly protein CpaF [Alphaproteobacteria bacterium]MBM3950956.1 pilus assembly protein CpaF [Rhodospirillales bacterium]